MYCCSINLYMDVVCVKTYKSQIKELHIKCIFWFQKLIFRYMFHEFEFLLLKILSCFDVKKKSILWYQKFKLIFFYIIRYIFWYQKTEKEWRYWFGLMLLFFSKNLYINNEYPLDLNCSVQFAFKKCVVFKFIE